MTVFLLNAPGCVSRAVGVHANGLLISTALECHIVSHDFASKPRFRPR